MYYMYNTTGLYNIHILHYIGTICLKINVTNQKV